MQRPIQAELEALQAKAAPAPKPAAPAPKPAAPAPKPAAPAPKPAPPKAATEPGPAEWYVGIDGEPVGPIDKGYLEEQIAEGKVTGSSLVWREELTDWRPLNSFAELRSLLTTRAPAPISSAATSAPVALTRAKEVPPKPASAEPPESRKPAPSAPDSAQPVPDSRASGDLSESSVPSAAEEVPPSTGMPVGLAGLAPPPSAKPSSTVAETPEAKDAGAVGLGAAGTGAAGTGAADEPAPKEAQPAAPPVVEPSEPTKAAEPDEDDLALAGIPADRRRQGRGLTPMAYAFIAMATAFGAVSAWFLFGQREGSQPVAQAPSGTALTGESDLGGPPPSGAETSEPTAKVDATASAEPDDDGEATTSGVGARVGTSASATSTSETTEPEDDGGSSDEPPPCSPDDPFCGTGPSGPSAAPDDDGGSGSGAGLSPSQAQSVVSRYKGSLMRRCRSMVTKGSAKVGATIVVGASGAVKSVAVSGGGDYPGLAGCVRSRIKNWSFPSSGGSTTINVSFNFL